ncbi:hypothetical protein EKO27_g572 [Xylaria grammica]|uniref:Uncharacterized protein n=1 Tax=Xylaria grammica TaxID=363999 RepID=A0A439DJD9_9PEZI|nr:hypothetical protein EKO27_g572 [Xylaria grammica]
MTKPNDVIAVVLTVLILGAFIAFYACVYRVRAAAAAAASSDEDEEEGEDDGDGYAYEDEYYGARSSDDAFLSTSADSAHVGAQVPHPEPAVAAWGDRGNGDGDGVAGADTGASAGVDESTSAESQSSDPRSAGGAGSVSSPQAVDEENPGHTR